MEEQKAVIEERLSMSEKKLQVAEAAQVPLVEKVKKLEQQIIADSAQLETSAQE